MIKKLRKNTLEAWKSQPSVDFTPSAIGATRRDEKKAFKKYRGIKKPTVA